MLRWSSAIHLNQWGGEEYYIHVQTSDFGPDHPGRGWAYCAHMTQEMVEDDWLPDIVARINRLHKQAEQSHA